MATDKPGERYFQPKHGEWSGEYRFAVSSYGLLFSSSMQWLGKLSAMSMSIACRLLGAFRIETEVDTTNLPQRDVLHKTKILKWGVVLYQSEEHFLFDEDGKKMKVRGWQRMLPLWWRVRDYGDSFGEVAEDGEHASYVFLWFGAQMAQRSTPTARGLLFTQELPGCHARFLLHQRAGSG